MWVLVIEDDQIVNMPVVLYQRNDPGSFAEAWDPHINDSVLNTVGKLSCALSSMSFGASGADKI